MVWDILDYSSATANGIPKNLQRTSSIKFLFFGPIGKQRWPPCHLIGIHIRLLLFNRWTEFKKNLTRIKISTPSIKLVFRSENKDGRHGLRLAMTFFDFFCATTKQNPTKLTMKLCLNYLYKVVFFGPIGKRRLQYWPLIGWDIFDFSSVTVEQNSTKLGTKPHQYPLPKLIFHTEARIHINILCQSWFFTPIGKSRWQPLHLIGWYTFHFSSTAEKFK